MSFEEKKALELKRTNPEKYARAQEVGAMIMEKKYNNIIEGVDQIGITCELQSLLNSINYYGLTYEDLTRKEKLLLQGLYGPDKNNWKIFTNS